MNIEGYQQKKNINEDGKRTDNFLIRSLYWTLLQPVFQSYNKYQLLGEFEEQILIKMQEKAFENIK